MENGVTAHPSYGKQKESERMRTLRVGHNYGAVFPHETPRFWDDTPDRRLSYYFAESKLRDANTAACGKPLRRGASRLVRKSDPLIRSNVAREKRGIGKQSRATASGGKGRGSGLWEGRKHSACRPLPVTAEEH
ncbi:hypothetical protein SKAU_G00230490 [Synaphobranchus kaupii]|uniref:Uncharacterized protein n=1 Tax=Synaphobranchus kaupii TaxID=118154 RepID=A0A9Q1F5K0_SYNKA|nr:hypothetical protein SKAU_G00230490 [Synaphobranchus kaupii]